MNQHKTINNWVLFIILTAAACSVGLIWLNTLHKPTSLAWTEWAFFEWLINYQSGFIRRGLTGEWLHTFFYNREILALNYLSFIFGVVYILFSVQLLIEKPKAGNAALLYVFAPTGFFALAISNEIYFRKEMFFYLAIFAIAALYRKWCCHHHQTFGLMIVSLILLSTILIPFIHEGYIFFCALIYAKIIFNILEKHYSKQFVRQFLMSYLGFNLVLLIILFFFKGNAEFSNIIWNSLSASTQSFSPNGEINGGLTAIGWSAMKAIGFPVRVVLTGLASYYLFPWLLIFLINGLIYANLNAKTLLSVYLSPVFISNFALVTLTFLPLFVLGRDWGRWLYGINFVFSLMIFSDLLLENYLPKLATIKSYLQTHARTVFFLCLLIISFFTRTPECCLSGSGFSLLSVLSNFTAAYR